MLWAHHLATRWAAAFRSPRECLVGVCAAFMLTNGPVKPWWLNGIGGLLSAGMPLLLVTWFMAGSCAGRGTSGRFPSFGTSVRSEMRDIPNASLPLDPGTRALAEALAGVGILAVWQTLLVVLAPLLNPLFHLDLGNSVFASLSGTFATWCVLVPCAMAWLLPSQTQVVNLLRGATVTVLAVDAFVMSLGSMPLAIDIAVGLVAALLATARVAMIPGPFTLRGVLHAGGSRAQQRAVMFRQPRAPLARLWRDTILGPLRSGTLPLVACAACFMVVGALARAHLGPERFAAFVTTMGPLLVAGWLALHPLGTPLTTVGRGARTGLFGGDTALAWTRLPLRRVWVMRAFYVHGMMAGLTFFALSVLGSRTTGSLSVFSIPGEPFRWFPYLCAVPPAAGAMTCMAAGDPVRGVVSVVSLFLIQTTVPYGSMLSAAMFALAGGLPPLVHLFDGRGSNRPAERGVPR
jgi:hypothetical protein